MTHETISTICGFVGGTVFGAVVGVAVDRMYRQIENRVRVEITPSMQPTPPGAWIAFTVKNRGSVELPPHKLCIQRSDGGRMFLFNALPPHVGDDPDVESKPLLPDQSRVHRMDIEPRVLSLVKNIDADRGPPVTGYDFTLEKINSDIAFFRSRIMGDALVKYLLICASQGKIATGIHEQGLWSIRKVFRDTRRKQAREISQAMKNHEARTAKS